MVWPLPTYDQYGRKTLPDIPHLPFVSVASQSTSKLISRCTESNEYPALFAKNTRMKGVLEKNTFSYYRPMEVIGACYTPSAQCLRIEELSKKKRKRNTLFNEDGSIRLPVQNTSNETTSEVPSRVHLRDLLLGTYFRDKAAVVPPKKRRKSQKPQTEFIFEAQLPIDIDDQKEILITSAETELHKYVRETDIIRITFYLEKGIDDDNIPPFDSSYVNKVIKCIPKTYQRLKNYKRLIAENMKEVEDSYKLFTKMFLLDYALYDECEMQRLRIKTKPSKYPVLVLRSPVPWRCNVNIATQFMERHYFCGNPILLKIRDIWYESFAHMLILPLSEFSGAFVFPLDANTLKARTVELCNQSRQRIEVEFMHKCADLFVDMKWAWRHLVPPQGTNVKIVEQFFRCVQTLMSILVRNLLMRSVEHVMSLLQIYHTGNDFGDDYCDLAFTNNPIIKVTARAVPGSGDIQFVPSMVDMGNLVAELLMKVIEVNVKIPRIEMILFPELDNKPQMSLHYITHQNEVMHNVLETANNYFVANSTGCAKYVKLVYENYKDILTGEAEDSLVKFMHQEPFPLMKDFVRRLQMYHELKEEILMLRRIIPLNMFSLELADLNEFVYHAIEELCDVILNYFVHKNHIHNRAICDYFDEMSQKITETPSNVAELAKLINYIAECRDVTMFNLREKIRQTGANLDFLMQHASLSQEELQLNVRVFLWPKDMDNLIEMASQRSKLRRDQAVTALRAKQQEFDRKLKSLEMQVTAFKKKDPSMLSMEDMLDNVAGVDALMLKLHKAKAKAEKLNEEEQFLNVPISVFFHLNAMFTSLEPYEKLWHIVLDFHTQYEIWYYGPFSGLDADAISEQVEDMWKMLYKLEKTLHDNASARRVAESVRGKIEKFRQAIPVLQTICNKGMKDRHWEPIWQAMGARLPLTPASTLSEMIEAGMLAVISVLEEVGAAASREYSIEDSLKKMKEQWEDVVFELIPYRTTGVYILSAVDDIQVLLDDQILKAQTMRGSPYIKSFEEEMIAWEEKLLAMQDILEQWLTCQSTWMYLQPIFSSEDIMKQMPTDTRNFKQVDRTWRLIQRNTVTDAHAIVATNYPDMLAELKRCNQLLDEIQKGLNSYLESKRLFFPRFFFLSNDELLEILSESKDPLRVQPHLKKCFEGIYLLRFQEGNDIIGMISAENEYVPFCGTISPQDVNGMVELWLAQVQAVMLQTLRELITNSLRSYAGTTRQAWILDWPGQVVQCVNCILWTTNVANSIVDGSLAERVDECTRNIELSVQMVQGKLEPGAQITVEALIVIDVHGRDIVRKLRDNKIDSVAHFDWISQLRYYCIDSNVTANMITTNVAYGYEYLGNTGRLVATPLTDRCYRTLMGALKLNLGGAPEGPAGTGKTETVRDLAKAVAKKCVVFNCSEGLDYKSLGKFFMGLAQAGCWACFDEFNRIELEVLSVVAQQILCIQLAIAAKLDTFVFEGTTLVLDRTCNCFITMNPGYAGRQELPDNLKILFRTVAMMVPDYAMIGEVSLYSYGFLNAAILSQKIVHTYKLCSEQLSSQNHYDYGMRAVKSVLLAAGKLKRSHPKIEEAQLVLRAIIDVNLPKFLAQDVPLFEGIYSDLFADIEVPNFNREELISCAKEVLEERNLQATEVFLEKIMQIYEMILVRHGLMVVGGPMSGKSCAYQVLAQALTKLAALKEAKLREFRTIYRIINPKAISLGQLYGMFDPASHTWQDGVLATTFREYANSSTPDRKWIIFDGPVDAVWIENMNTVLDDNKKLCLMSGEIIQMTNKMNLIFEPEDLEQASPATVSRCGMIYMAPELLGWEPLLTSYARTLRQTLSTDQMKVVMDGIEWLIEPTFEYITHSCKCFLNASINYLFFVRCNLFTIPKTISSSHLQSFSRLFSLMLRDEGEYDPTWLQCTLIFCIAWGLGSFLTSEGRKSFDGFYRNILAGDDEDHPKPATFMLSKAELFPEDSNVFEWFYEKKNNRGWINFLEIVDHEQHIASNAKIGKLIIRTNKSCCQQFFLKKCLDNEVPILFLGPTGTGKSAIVFDHLIHLPTEKYITNVINFSARTSSTMTQEAVMSKLDKRRRGVYGPTMGKKCILFVDDVGMPQKEQWGSQPPIELLRQWIDHGHWFEKDTSLLKLTDVLFVGAMGKPGGGVNEVSRRFLRHMIVMCMDSFDDETLSKIFSTILEWHFAKGYAAPVARLADMAVSATLAVYKDAISNFLPTPAKSHYTFSLRDFTRVISGCLMIPPNRLKEPEKFMRLWVHESYRVFHDRLIDAEDREMLFEIVKRSLNNLLRQHIDQLFAYLLPPESTEAVTGEHLRSLFFGNYMEPNADVKTYDEVSDADHLSEKMDYYLKEYNMMSGTQMNLVMFQFAIEHVSRVSRVLNQQNGHMLLVGMAGTGRHSIVKLAASIAEFRLIEIEISKSYGVTDWRDDLKSVLLRVGIAGKPMVFLFADTQIAYESFTEDINTIINSGDVPNLYQPEEKAEILEKMQTAMRDSGRKFESTPLALFNLYIERIQENLHVAFCMSPIGTSFRTRVRMFPSLINCCTIDWLTNWPDDALEKVAVQRLSDMDIDEEYKSSCTQMCKYFHAVVQQESDDFYMTQKRKTYITPSSFLELLLLFKQLYFYKIDQIALAKNRYITGLEKLEFAAGQIGMMQQEIHELQPELVIASGRTEKLMIKIEQDTVIVEKQKEIVGADESVANEAAAVAQAIKDDCESDLAQAIPSLEAALQALNTLKPSDITVVKSMKNPPAAVKLVLEALCIMKGVKADRKQNASGIMVEDYWGPSLKLLGDMKFLENLKRYNKDAIPAPIMKRIRERYIPDREFEPARVKKVSKACEGLCKWIRAMDVYDRVIKMVAPKKASLAAAETDLAAQMETLNKKRAQLQEVTDKLQALNDEFAAETKKKKDLEDNIDMCSQKLDRAEKLISGLGGEKSRWSQTAQELNSSLDNVIGDVLLSAGVISYLGAFTLDYRKKIVKNWNEECLKTNLPCSPTFSLIRTMGEPVVIRSWNVAGLPIDNYSIENGIIATNSHLWPLMIDPQGPANKWIKKMEKMNQLAVVKLTDPNYMQVLHYCITSGLPVLLENVGEEMDASLEPVLVKNIFKHQGVSCLKMGDTNLEYNYNFRLYITTRLRNPHYLPEIAAKVTMINFTITPQGLQDQLLGIVVAQECPELESKKNAMIVERAHNKKVLKEIEDKILQVLSTSQGNILEDESAINILSSSKTLSEDIQEKQKMSAVTELEIDAVRNQYVPVSKHSSVLFFCISDMSNIDPMYQYSLTWFINIYNQSIATSPKPKNLEERIKTLNAFFTRSIHRNVCRSLFEKDKLIFSFVLAVGIRRAARKLDEELLSFLLTGGVAFSNPETNPAPTWLTDKSWSEIVRVSKLNGLADFHVQFKKSIQEWKMFYDSQNPQEEKYPAPYRGLLGLKRLIVMRCIRPDKVVPTVQQFIVDELGPEYLEPPQFNLQESYSDSNSCSPLIFILSPSSDPMAGLIRFGEEMGIAKTDLMTISLGQGQGPIAANMINVALKTGQWVVLQNCHLAASWMGELDRICDEVIVPESTNTSFRLWLTSYPSKTFPVAVLQNGVKMTNEAPTGFKLNVLRSYTSNPISDQSFFNSVPNSRPWQTLLFALCFFHSVVQERRKFGPLGWNIPYEFNESDLRICILQLQMFVTDYPSVPFDALRYLACECNYGGRVTDDKDRRLLASLLSIFYCERTVYSAQYQFSPSGIYYVPIDTSYESIVAYVKGLPLMTKPEVFGLHENADIAKDNQDTAMLLHGILLTQTQIAQGSEGADTNTVVIDLADGILEQLPNPYDIEAVTRKYPVLYENSMNTVLRQELIRFNRLLTVITQTLRDVIKATKGLVSMSPELEDLFYSLVVGKLPASWESKSYPSLKPLGSYINDLLARLDFFQTWIEHGPPVVFWLSGFFFTQSFLTGVLQNFSRKTKKPIDQVSLDFFVTEYETGAPEVPEIGVYFKLVADHQDEFNRFNQGLYLEGARWDRQQQQLNESYSKILYDSIPIIWLKPELNQDIAQRKAYDCPLYKTSARRGILSTTGHSTNFVIYIRFPSDTNEEHWINRGVAALCQLDD